MTPQGRLILSTRVVKATGRDETRDAISHDWYALLKELALLPLLVPNVESEVEGYLEGLCIRGMILTGGNNLCPDTYGEPDAKVLHTSAARDTTEKVLIRLAVRNHWPILGVCRGMQMLNAYFGGRILTDLSRQIGDRENHAGSEHGISIRLPEWKAKFGYDSLVVNSYHDQGFTEKELSHEFAVFAVSAKAGVVEGIAHKKLPIVGIMWHPERPNPARDFDRALLQSLFAER